MPYSIYWSYRQVLDMRVLAGELLRWIDRGGNVGHFRNEMWLLWLMLYGIPEPDDLEEVDDHEEFLREYRDIRMLFSVQYPLA